MCSSASTVKTNGDALGTGSTGRGRKAFLSSRLPAVSQAVQSRLLVFLGQKIHFVCDAERPVLFSVIRDSSCLCIRPNQNHRKQRSLKNPRLSGNLDPVPNFAARPQPLLTFCCCYHPIFFIIIYIRLLGCMVYIIHKQIRESSYY